MIGELTKNIFKATGRMVKKELSTLGSRNRFKNRKSYFLDKIQGEKRLQRLGLVTNKIKDKYTSVRPGFTSKPSGVRRRIPNAIANVGKIRNSKRITDLSSSMGDAIRTVSNLNKGIQRMGEKFYANISLQAMNAIEGNIGRLKPAMNPHNTRYGGVHDQFSLPNPIAMGRHGRTGGGMFKNGL
jgi:hypothetical protein